MNRPGLLMVGIGVLACALGCRMSCQSHLDYTGPTPAEASDFLYRKNSILGGDPSKTPVTTGPIEPAPEEEVPPGLVGEDLQEEATPEPAPGMDELDMQTPGRSDETLPESAPPEAEDGGQSIDAEGDSDGAAEREPQAQLEWHAPRPR